MEALMLFADALSIVLLALAVARARRTSDKPTLGLFAYKDIAKEKTVKGGSGVIAREKEGRDA